MSTFKPAWWLPTGHAQTIYRTFAHCPDAPIDHTERLELPDGDFIDLAWATGGLPSDTPLVIFLHGLGGDLNSTYVTGQLEAYNRHGWRAVFMYFRGASDEPNRLAKAYHSGKTDDLHVVLETLAKREPHTQKAVVGVSLGANVLLKWLGEQGSQTFIHASVAISPPFDLACCSTRINRGFSRLYQRHLLTNMRKLFQRKHEHNPNLLPKHLHDLTSHRSFWDFDEHVTAPLHGFPDATTYYRKSSSRQFLIKIKTPTLMIHALDDPLMTADIVPKAHELSSDITFDLSPKGGHVGFISGHIPGKPIYWLEQRVPEFLKNHFNNS
jgi:uncharacterized protein